jgi:hypothetical protein
MKLLVHIIAIVASAASLSPRALGVIEPRWVQVGPGAPNQPAGVTTYSLVVDLSNTSLFNVAIMLATLPEGNEYFNHPIGSFHPPYPEWFAPPGGDPSVAYDTYVATTHGFAQPPSIPGRAFEPGAAIVGVGRLFDVAWGATPNSGPPLGQGLEIARLSVIGGGIPVVDERSAVFSSDAPNVIIPIPPLPEPGVDMAMLVMVGLAGRSFRSPQ